jgi:6,7-dimethyl-8-ribityllumazine synthase
MSESTDDSQDWPLRDWSTRLRPPAGSERVEAEPEPEPAEPEPEAEQEPELPQYSSDAEILYEDVPDEEQAEEAEPALTAEPEPEPEPVLAAAAVPEPESEPAPELEPEPAAESEPETEHAEGDFRIPDGYAVLEGTPTGERRSVAIVVSRFNGEITNRLLESALDELDDAGVAQQSVLIMPVPGAFELPIAAMALAKTRRYACIIALGCVIRGETPHFDFVASEAASGLQLAGIETGVPVSFGLLTCETAEQAEARVDRGAKAARAALEMADVFAQLRTTLAAARGQ